VKLISGGKVNLAALGFGMGDVVLLELLQARGKLPGFDPAMDVFCLIEDEELRGETLQLIQRLRSDGFSVEYPLTPAKSDKQFKRALELGARFAVILERSAVTEPMVRLKSLETRQEQTVSLDEATAALRRG
jgi:histidyl-tRNA synthetase